MAETMAKQKGPQHLLMDDDVLTVREVIARMIESVEPNDRKQREIFAALMPDLYVLRMKGFGFVQLAEMLNKCNFKLQLSTVRTYYNEMLASKMELCEARFDKQLVILAKTEEHSTEDVAAYAAKIAQAKERQRAAVAERVEAVFDKKVKLSETQQGVKLAAAQAPRVVKTTPPTAATAEPASGQGEDSGFGLLAGTNSTVVVRPGAGFIVMDDDAPQVPILEPKPAPKPKADAPATASKLHCAKLQTGIEPLEKRDGVPAEVYEKGLLEHPAIPGLMLKKEERLYGALLEIIEETTGEVRLETLDEKRFRIKWKRPIPVGTTDSKKNFTEMDTSLFGHRTEN